MLHVARAQPLIRPPHQATYSMAAIRSGTRFNACERQDIMIRHVLVFKHNAEVTEDERNRWMDSVRRLANEVPTVRNLTIGSDMQHLPRSYDVALVVDFESREDLLTYERHPAHVAVATVSRRLADHIASVDFEW